MHGLMLATFTGLVGRQLSVVAIPWFVLSTTGSAGKAGLVGFAVFLPGLLVGIFGGVLVDRLGYRRVSVASDLVCAVSTALIPLLYLTIGLAFWQLLVLVFFSSLLDVPALTARRSMVPELAGLAGVRIERVNALFESLQNLAGLLGMPIAGLLVAWLGAEQVLWIDAGASAASALIVLATIPNAAFARVAVASRGYLADVLAGLRFIRRDALLWPMAVVLAVSNAVSVGTSAVVLPVYVMDRFGSAASLGILLAAIGAGAFVGASIYGAVAGDVPRRLLWVGAYMLMPLEVWVFLVSPGIAVLIAAFVVVGLAAGPLNPLMVTVRHERSPAELRGRVFSTYSAIAMAAQPLGVLVAGQLIEGIGLSPTVLALAILAQSLGVAALLLPAFRRLDDPAARHPGLLPARP
jgi:predicted MFS family arabinose efflux permease